jgi:hypothetical protein
VPATYRFIARQHTGSSVNKGLAEQVGFSQRVPIILPSDPTALLDRLDLLLASHRAGNTGVRNEIVSICDELRRQGVVNDSKYKYLMNLYKMIVQKSHYIRTHVVGGGGIFDTIANIVKRITGNTVGDLASKLWVGPDAGTPVSTSMNSQLMPAYNKATTRNETKSCSICNN